MPRIRNPFERALVDRLEGNVCSPGMFRMERRESNNFKWDIEQVSILQPADIVACSSQFEATPDPALERRATRAIDQFFSQESIVPSPASELIRRPLLNPTPDTATKNLTRIEECTQTELSFPINLPEDVDNALRPYYFPDALDSQNDPDNSVNASLRRKLRFEEFSDEDEQISEINQVQETRGLKRALETSFESAVLNTSEINMITKSLNDEKSPSPVMEAGTNTQLCDEIMRSLKSPSLSPIHHVSRSQEKMSSDTPQAYQNDSIFSQSTPEKTNSYKLTFPVDASSMTDCYDIDKNYMKYSHVSQLTDYRMDISCDSLNYPKKQSVFSDVTNTLSTAGNVKYNFNIPEGIRSNPKTQFCDKSAIDEGKRLSEFYEHFTPKKSNKEYLFDIVKSPMRKSSYTPISSPMRMSLDNEFNIDMDKLLKNHSHNMTRETTLFVADSHKSGFQRTDSGFLDQFTASSSAIYNSTKFESETSGIRWKRFDSGFHDETSSELTADKKFSPINEYLESDENAVDFNNFKFNAKPHESMSDIFTNVRFQSNFSSTPSKNHK